MSDESSLTLSIGAVSKATGIPSNTLRTWERRYGFPKPVRTEGGQRAYSASVVSHLTEIARALDRGLRPRDVLSADLADLRRWAGSEVPSGDDASLEPMLASVHSLDAEGLDRALQVHWAHRGGIPFLDDIAGPFLCEVGEAWAAGRIEVYQEHFASEVLRNFLARTWRPLADHARGPTVVVANPPCERHDLGLHFAATALALCGRRVGFLGARTPIRDIVEAAALCNAEAVACSLSLETLGKNDREVQALSDALPADLTLLLGGGGAPPIEGAVVLQTCAALKDWALNGP